MIDSLDEYYDIPTILTSVNSEEVYDGDFTTRRVVIWTLTFTMKGYFFGPVTNKKIIKFANTNFYASPRDGDFTTNAEPAERVKIYPGLTANGEPTTLANNTIDYTEINKDDDWGYIVIIEDA